MLYTFKAVGAEELSLERGALVEVLRIECGPWWFGRTKMDAILCGPQNEPRQGWFPRDFVKVSRSFDLNQLQGISPAELTNSIVEMT